MYGESVQNLVRNDQTEKKRRKTFQPSLKEFDEQLYRELHLEDDRNAETLALRLGYRSKTPVENSFDRLCRLNVLRLDPMPNGARRNPRYRKIKLAGDSVRALDLYRAPHYENWNHKNRMQLIQRYVRIGWNIVPIRKDKKPIMSKASWGGLREKQKLSMFRDQVLGVGMWIDDLVIFDFDHTDQVPEYETLTTKSPHGYHCYFWRTPNTRHISSFNGVAQNVDIKAKSSFIVLPPTHGYEWLKLISPAHLPDDLFEMWERRGLWKIKSIATADDVVRHEKFALPDELVYPHRDDGLFRYGRSLRASGFGQTYITNELLLVNQMICKPPLESQRLEKILTRVFTLKDSAKFSKSRKNLVG